MNKEQPAKSPRKPVLEQVKQLIILTRTSLFLNHLETSTEVAELVCQQIKAIIGQGYVALTLLDDLTQTFSVSATGGFEDDNLIKAGLTFTGTDPTKIQVPAKDLTPEDLTNYQSGRLELLEDGLYALLIRKYPRTTCSAIGRLFSICNVYTMGFAHRGQHIGGIAILTDSGEAVEKTGLS